MASKFETAIKTHLSPSIKAGLRAAYGLPVRSPKNLVRRHFWTWSSPRHITRGGFELALRSLEGRPATILETGTAAWGTDSTRLFDAYVSHFGGNFYSVDNRPEPAQTLSNVISKRTTLAVDDSVRYINSPLLEGLSFDLIYLDSWDVDWRFPQPAAEHGLKEWIAIQPHLRPGSLILIDDTPADLSHVPGYAKSDATKSSDFYGYLPGKGALILKGLSDENRKFEVLWHAYNLLIRYER